MAAGKDHGKGARRSMRSAMRLVLRFTTELGWTTADLVDAVPSMRSYRLSTVPRALGDKEVAQLLASLAGVNARDRAIVHLLVTYGARRQQVAALKLQDIDWGERILTFGAHKGGKAVIHVLTPLVAESLATYLRHERPDVASDAVFLRRLSPHLRVSPSCVTEAVLAASREIGRLNGAAFPTLAAFTAPFCARPDSGEDDALDRRFLLRFSRHTAGPVMDSFDQVILYRIGRRVDQLVHHRLAVDQPDDASG